MRRLCLLVRVCARAAVTGRPQDPSRFRPAAESDEQRACAPGDASSSDAALSDHVSSRDSEGSSPRAARTNHTGGSEPVAPAGPGNKGAPQDSIAPGPSPHTRGSLNSSGKPPLVTIEKHRSRITGGRSPVAVCDPRDPWLRQRTLGGARQWGPGSLTVTSAGDRTGPGDVAPSVAHGRYHPSYAWRATRRGS